jgi:hypothetical protein
MQSETSCSYRFIKDSGDDDDDDWSVDVYIR